MKLPNTIIINTEEIEEGLCEEIADFVSDYISDKTGFCHEGFSLEITIKASGIMWDTDED